MGRPRRSGSPRSKRSARRWIASPEIFWNTATASWARSAGVALLPRTWRRLFLLLVLLIFFRRQPQLFKFRDHGRNLFVFADGADQRGNLRRVIQFVRMARERLQYTHRR